MIWIVLFIILIITVNRVFRKIESELSWMSNAIINDKELKKKQNRAASYNFIIAQVGNSRVWKGIGIEKFEEICREKPNCDYWKHESVKCIEYNFYGYGEDLPTPILILKFKEGRLESYKFVNNDSHAPFHCAFYKK